MPTPLSRLTDKVLDEIDTRFFRREDGALSLDCPLDDTVCYDIRKDYASGGYTIEFPTQGTEWAVASLDLAKRRVAQTISSKILEAEDTMRAARRAGLAPERDQ